MHLYWVNTMGDVRVAIAQCPEGDEHLPSEMASLRVSGVDVLVSLQTPMEMQSLGLKEEPRECERAGMRFRWLPVVDHQVPSSQESMRRMVETLQAELAMGKTVAAHCFAGVGRSVVLVACLLCALGWTPAESVKAISEARGFCVPETDEQLRWVEEFAATIKSPAR
jgi:protein-tyrosine phosphatase